MTNRETEEKLRKLASVDRAMAEGNWRFYLSGEGAERSLAEDLIDVQLFNVLGKDYRERVFLEPPPAAACSGLYDDIL